MSSSIGMRDEWSALTAMASAAPRRPIGEQAGSTRRSPSPPLLEWPPRGNERSSFRTTEFLDSFSPLLFRAPRVQGEQPGMGRHIGFQSEHGRHGGGGSARRAGCRDGGTGSCMGISRRPGVGRMAAQADPGQSGADPGHASSVLAPSAVPALRGVAASGSRRM